MLIRLGAKAIPRHANWPRKPGLPMSAPLPDGSTPGAHGTCRYPQPRPLLGTAMTGPALKPPLPCTCHGLSGDWAGDWATTQACQRQPPSPEKGEVGGREGGGGPLPDVGQASAQKQASCFATTGLTSSTCLCAWGVTRPTTASDGRAPPSLATAGLAMLPQSRRCDGTTGRGGCGTNTGPLVCITHGALVAQISVWSLALSRGQTSCPGLRRAGRPAVSASPRAGEPDHR